jgi:hypothetical protein
MTREKIKGTAGKKNHGHEIQEAPDFYKEMATVEDHRHHTPSYYSENRDDFMTIMAKPVPILADFSGRVTTKNTHRSDVGRLLDPWLDFPGEQKIACSSSSKKKKDSCCNLHFFTGNVASVVLVNKEHIEDGDEVFFEGKRFHFVGTSVPTPAVEDFCWDTKSTTTSSTVTAPRAGGPIGGYSHAQRSVHHSEI